jgi:dTDP-4-dehydrorhamnose 3,5-epimerase-like enzyme
LKKLSYEKPHIITFTKRGNKNIGYLLSLSLENSLPFKPQRFFITHETPDQILRGRHAHYKTEQVLICSKGKIIVVTEDALGEIQTFNLQSPNQGLYLPPNVWHTMQYQNEAIQLVFASTEYDEKDYIREYDNFKKHWGAVENE